MEDLNAITDEVGLVNLTKRILICEFGHLTELLPSADLEGVIEGLRALVVG